jgi:hypothetical protein
VTRGRFQKLVALGTVLVPCLISSVGCSRSDLTRSRAGTLIMASPAFQEPLTLNFSTGTDSMPLGRYCGWNPKVCRLRDLGLVDLQASGNFWTKKSLTDKGKEASRGWILRKRAEAPPSGAQTRGIFGSSEEEWGIPLATRSFVEVTGITVQPAVTQGRIVEFSWKWNPTEMGEAFRVGNDLHKASANFLLYDDGWRLVSNGL